MTLILSVVTTVYAIQVSDRLLTQSTKEYDSLANKTIMFAGRDCLISLSYTGSAFINGKRTDDFLASCIEPYTTQHDDGTIFQDNTSTLLAKLDIGLAVRAIKEGLEKVTDNALRKNGLRVVACGWQDCWKRRKRTERPCMIEIVKLPNEKDVGTRWIIPRYWHYKPVGVYIGNTPNGHLLGVEVKDLAEFVCKLSWKNIQAHADSTKEYLVNLIQKVSERSDFIGPDCMSVLLPAPALVVTGNMEGVIEFIPSSKRFINTSEGDKLPVVYTPWQIGYNWFESPSRIFGTGAISRDIGGVYKLKTLLTGYEDAQNRSGLSFSFSGSERRGLVD